jgi:hypothetical protein
MGKVHRRYHFLRVDGTIRLVSDFVYTIDISQITLSEMGRRRVAQYDRHSPVGCRPGAEGVERRKDTTALSGAQQILALFTIYTDNLLLSFLKHSV